MARLPLRSGNGRTNAPIPASAGIGLRFQHHHDVIANRPQIGWMEVHPENYMGGGTPLAHLTAIRHDMPISLHGVGLSLGSAEGIDAAHLKRLAELAERIEPGLISEHVAWTVSDGIYLADLLPLPLTEEALDGICRNIVTAQVALGRQILVENPSTYLRYQHSTIPEWEFMSEVSRATGCGILCDVNNIAVSAANHGFDAYHYLDSLPSDRIGEIHVAGHSIRTLDNDIKIRIDDHASPVSPEVWHLLEYALHRFGPVPVLVEWDTDVPPLDVLLREAKLAERILTAARRDRDA
jgi:uncharacterized protein (UPF0276 family)